MMMMLGKSGCERLHGRPSTNVIPQPSSSRLRRRLVQSLLSSLMQEFLYYVLPQTGNSARVQERRYLLKEFPELGDEAHPLLVLEVGCGTGSSVVPVLR